MWSAKDYPRGCWRVTNSSFPLTLISSVSILTQSAKIQSVCENRFELFCVFLLQEKWNLRRVESLCAPLLCRLTHGWRRGPTLAQANTRWKGWGPQVQNQPSWIHLTSQVSTRIPPSLSEGCFVQCWCDWCHWSNKCTLIAGVGCVGFVACEWT